MQLLSVDVGCCHKHNFDEGIKWLKRKPGSARYAAISMKERLHLISALFAVLVLRNSGKKSRFPNASDDILAAFFAIFTTLGVG